MSGANPHRGEVSLALVGRALTLRPSFAALVAIERDTGLGLMQLAYRLGCGSVEHLPIGMLTVQELLSSLSVDRLIRYDPQHESRVARQIPPKQSRQRRDREIGFSASRGHFENGVGN